MTVHIALMRGIHAGGRDRISAFNLRAFLSAPDCGDTRALLQSGNLVFGSQGRTPGELEYLIEMQADRRIGMASGFMVRTADEWAAVVARNPFAAQPPCAGRLVVMLLKDAPERAAVQALHEAAGAGPDTIQVDGRQVYLVYPRGIGQSRLTCSLIESTLATRGAARSWGTVLRLAALARLTAP